MYLFYSTIALPACLPPSHSEWTVDRERKKEGEIFA